MRKQNLRKSYLNKRSKISDEDYVLLSEKIKNLLINHFVNSNLNVHIYLSNEKKKEVNTNIIIKELENRNCNISIPMIDDKNNIIKNCLLNINEVFKENRYGIKEPIFCKPYNAKNLDLIIVPGLICDTEGNRVGYGKGYYDKFLKTCTKKDSIKVVLNFFDPISKIDDIDELDVPIDFYITPGKIFKFNETIAK